MTFFLRALDIFKQLGDILHVGHTEEVAWRTPYIGGGAFGIPEEGVEP
jgi:hypothetical protein